MKTQKKPEKPKALKPKAFKSKALSDKKLSGPALKAFFNIAEKWQLNDNDKIQLLGSPGRTTFYKWKASKSGTLPKDTLERISYILGIYKALHLIFSDSKIADEWVNKPNKYPLFGGKSAISRMLSGNVADLYVVRQYLDAQRGVWA